MVISDGSHIVKGTDTKMIRVSFNMTITGDVIFFAKNKELVEEYINNKLNNLKMPLPFGGHDGSINTKLNDLNIQDVRGVS